MRLAFYILWSLSTAILVVIPNLYEFSGRNPSGTFPLDGAASTALRHRYLVFPKIHHTQYNQIRNNLSKIQEQLSHYASTPEQLQKMRDSLVDFANPLSFVIMPPLMTSCGELVARYDSHSVALERALRGYWQRGGLQKCTEIVISVVDEASDPHLEFKAVKRETGRVIILNNQGGALAQLIMWRDDKMKLNTAQVQPLDPVLDVGSGFSSLPVDWPRLQTHRQSVRSITELRVPFDPYIKNSLIERGQSDWACGAQLLGLKYRDSWGRTATAQWCYGDTFPKILENDHYYAYRIEESL